MAATRGCSPEKACDNAAILDKPSRPSVVCESVLETRHPICHSAQDLRRQARIAVDQANLHQKSLAADGAVHTNHRPLITAVNYFSVDIHYGVSYSSAAISSNVLFDRWKEGDRKLNIILKFIAFGEMFPWCASFSIRS